MLTLVFCVPATGSAGINQQIHFQGKVVQKDGTNVANDSYDFVFKLYSVASGGAATWTESKSLAVTDGIFHTNLGSDTALPGGVDFNSDSWYLGMSFNGDPEMSPRIRLTAVPYAFNAQSLSGLSADDLLRSNASDTYTGAHDKTLTLQSLLTGGARTGNLLEIVQGNDATYSQSAGALLAITNQDTDSTAPLLVLSNSGSGAALQLAEGTSVANGLQWGTDTNLYRSAADTLKTDDSLIVGGASLTAGGLEFSSSFITTTTADTMLLRSNKSITNVIDLDANESNQGWAVYNRNHTVTANQLLLVSQTGQVSINQGGSSGGLVFGDGSGLSYDTNLYRSATNTLKTDDVFVATGLTLDLAQDYTFGARGDYLTLQGQAAGLPSQLEIYSKDGDGTDSSLYVAVGKGTPGDLTNSEYGFFGYNPAVSGYVLNTEASGTGTIRSLMLQTDSANALEIDSAQKIWIGTTKDTNLYRGGADLLRTDDAVVVSSRMAVNTTATDSAWELYVNGDLKSNGTFEASNAVRLYNATGSGTAFLFGDNAGTFDTNLYRSAANTLKTDDSLTVGGTALTLLAQGDLLFYDADSSHYVGFQSPATVASSVLWTLPNTDASGCLSSNGSGALSWTTCGAGGGGAPTDAQYLTLATNATLTNERVLQGTANQVILTDAGAGGNLTLSLPQSIATSSNVQFGKVGLGTAAAAESLLHLYKGVAGTAPPRLKLQHGNADSAYLMEWGYPTGDFTGKSALLLGQNMYWSDTAAEFVRSDTANSAWGLLMTTADDNVSLVNITPSGTNVGIAQFTKDGQLKLSQTGASAGLLLGTDAGLYRGAANELMTDDLLAFSSSKAADAVDFKSYKPNSAGGTQFIFDTSATINTASLLAVRNNGTVRLALSNAGRLELPATGATAGVLLGGDANLYRSAADTLKTDDAFISSSLSTGAITGTSIVLGSTVLSSNLPTNYIALAGSGLIQGGSSGSNSSYLNFTTEASPTPVAGYGAWLTHDLYWDSANTTWRKPRGSGVYGMAFGATHHLGFTWRSHTATVTNNDPVTLTEVMNLSRLGQLSLPVQGSTGGLVIGADTSLYRSAADVLKTDDTLQFSGGRGFQVADTSGKRGQGLNFNIDSTGSSGSYLIFQPYDTGITGSSANQVSGFILTPSGTGAGSTIFFNNNSETSGTLQQRSIIQSNATVGLTLLTSAGASATPTSIFLKPGNTTALEVDTSQVFWIGSTKDTNLYRSAANELKTDDSFTVAGSALSLLAQSDLLYYDSDSSNYVGFQSPAAVGSNVLWTLPSTDSSGCLSSNGSGTLSWGACSGGSGMASFTLAGTDGVAQTISNADTLTIAAGADITTTAAATDTITIANASTLATVTGRGATTTTGLALNGGVTSTLVNGAAASANAIALSGTLGIMNGSDNFKGIYLNYTNANHTGSANTVRAIDINNITGDAEATEIAINIGTGWDNGLATASKMAITSVNAAGGSLDALTLSGTLGAFNGSDTFRGIYLNYTNANHASTGNNFRGIDIGNITGDAEATETAINIGTGWDYGVTIPLGGTAALNLSDTGGTAAGGLLLGGDTNLYRSAAGTLKTDDALLMVNANNSYTLRLEGQKQTDGSLSAQQIILDTAAYNASPVAGLNFGFKYTSGGASAAAGGLSLGKENATDGNYASYLAFHTRTHGSNTAERLRLDSAGTLILSSASDTRIDFKSNKTVNTTNEVSFIFDTAANVTSGSLLSVRNNGVAKFTVTNAGNLISTGTLTQNGTPGDVAENIPVSDPSIGAGEIVAPDPLYPGQVRKATASDRMIAGVISTEYAILLSGATDGKPLALAGRVPVRVSDANGAIRTGDVVVTSSTPGVGVKASSTGSTVMVGVALTNQDSNSSTVIVQLQPGFYTEATGVAQQSEALSPQRQMVLDSFSVLQDGTLRLASLSVQRLAVEERLLVSGDIVVSGRATFAQTPIFNQDTAGQAVIKTPAQSVVVTFQAEYPEVPVVNATLAYDGVSATEREAMLRTGYSYLVSDRSRQGFTIYLSKPAEQDLIFNWSALAVPSKPRE